MPTVVMLLRHLMVAMMADRQVMPVAASDAVRRDVPRRRYVRAVVCMPRRPEIGGAGEEVRAAPAMAAEMRGAGEEARAAAKGIRTAPEPAAYAADRAADTAAETAARAANSAEGAAHRAANSGAAETDHAVTGDADTDSAGRSRTDTADQRG
jgi:hypothetical protein